MKPYLTPHPTLAVFLEWGILVVTILLVFSPFIYLGFRKWKKHLPVDIKWVLFSYFCSFWIYIAWDLVLLSKIDRFIYNNYINTGWLQDAITDPGFKMIFINVLGWPLLVFYCTKLMKNRFTRRNFILSFLTSLLFFCVLAGILIFAIGAAFAYAGSHYF